MHLVAGPPFTVFTSNVSTERWFDDHFAHDCSPKDGGLHETPWWNHRYGQSDVGILLQVEGNVKTASHGPPITELLLYAALPVKLEPKATGLVTPPRSSSPAVDQHDSIRSSPVAAPQLYAIPLSSELDPGSVAFVEPKPPPLENSVHDSARFFHPRPINGMVNQHGQKKRQSLDFLFNDATQQVKRSKKRGGESVAKAMASLNKQSSQNQGIAPNNREIVYLNANATSIAPRMRAKDSRNPGLSRAHSLGSMRDLEENRPPSRSSAIPVKRSTLNRVASAAAFESSSPAPETLNSVEQQNKTALIRIVMAGMRMYGVLQKKRPGRSRAASETPLSVGRMIASFPSSDNEDEYKLVYHQTYKAASFAFRRHIATTPISQGIMRDTVDRILEMFCVNPIPNAQDLGASQHGFGDVPRIDHSSFDSPSAHIVGEVPLPL